ncbi:MAG: hypothetical protein IKC32_02890 [Clostridia bacterium]|nr:hypothetical protein [Clostridia bacterium]
MLDYKMTKVTSVEEGVRRLLTVRDRAIPDFRIEPKGEGEYTDHLVLEGERIPLLDARYDPRMNGIRNYGRRAPGENCIINTVSHVGRDVSLDDLIYKELDLAEYALVDRIVSVSAFINGGACNLLAKCERGAVAGLELGATLAEGTIPQINHRLITKHGCATDRTVNNVVEQSGVYLFTSDDPRPKEFNDGEYYLYGLSIEESHRAAFIHAIMLGKVDKNELIEQDKHLSALVAAVHRSNESGECESISGGAV